MLKSTLKYLILIFSLPLSISLNAESINYFKGDLDNAQNMAVKEGKMVFIDFYAGWSQPSKWMEKNTYTDPEVIKILNEKFIPIKIDIDQIEGYALKEKYRVQILPTLLFFDQNGKVIHRMEETLDAKKLLDVLRTKAEDWKPVKQAMNPAPGKLVYSSPASNSSDEKFKLQEAKKSYKLQLGLFTSYDYTLQYYNKLTGILTEPISILHDYKAGKLVYRVLVGNFDKPEDASVYKTHLKADLNIDAFVAL